ncbi:FtsK/SpoIIIE domain-containing protein [Haloglycomyces albus]|uniref:FtsK/SpoIIIE domain-containing protein n=1 Tax=Haloglycomyces albus TaxID=526067 RepID=UPI0004AFCA8E|nr:FtsK/SpoIIIE domain-containing protein [Haloglycomyces albus]
MAFKKSTSKQDMHSKRKVGLEWKAAAWAARHPGLSVGLPATGTAVAAYPTASAGLAAAAVGGMVAWGRAHPPSFDTVVLPWMRSMRRRWLSANFNGLGWKRNLKSCGLTVSHPDTGEVLVPRLVRLKAYSSRIEVATVKIHKGQTIRQFEDAAETVAAAFDCQRVSIEQVKPRLLKLIFQRSEPFTEVIPAPVMPAEPEEVDLTSVALGEDEYGQVWTENLAAHHLLVSGASGSGKNSITWAYLRSMAPLIRDGLVRIWMLDPKQTELSAGKDLAYAYAGGMDDVNEVVEAFLEDQSRVQKLLQDKGMRKFEMSTETPLNILIADEIGALMTYGDRDVTRSFTRASYVMTSQGRASGHLLHGYIQEPDKGTLPSRDLFTLRVCLRATSAAQPDMVLGENMRQRGALADEIPALPETAGIGFRVSQRSRIPVKIRAAYSDDDDITDLVRFCTTTPGAGERNFRLVA